MELLEGEYQRECNEALRGIQRCVDAQPIHFLPIRGVKWAL